MIHERIENAMKNQAEYVPAKRNVSCLFVAVVQKAVRSSGS